MPIVRGLLARPARSASEGCPRWRFGLVCFVSLAVVRTLPADGTVAPQFLVESTTGSAAGSLLELSDGWALCLYGNPEFKVPAGNLVELRRQGVPLPPPPADEQVLLTLGDRLPGRVLQLTGERLRFQPGLAGAGEMTLPLSSISVIWLRPPDGTLRPEMLRRELAAARRKRDAVRLRNGDLLEGTLTGLDAKKVTLEVDRKPTVVGRERVSFIALSTELGSGPRPKSPYARLVLQDGTRLSLASATSVDGVTLTGKTTLGTSLSVPVGEIVALYVLQGPAVYLSDLKPKRYEFTPYLGNTEQYPLVADASVAGRPLRLDGSVYDKGLGMHSACRVTYDLGGAYQRFEAVVGLDEDTGEGGAVRLQVLVDGKPRDLGKAADLTSAGGAVPVRLEVAGARELTLLVDFGPRGHVRDQVDWADARLIKAGDKHP